jgi:hypothetical protein
MKPLRLGCGNGQDRTDYLLRVMQALCQMSYAPRFRHSERVFPCLLWRGTGRLSAWSLRLVVSRVSVWERQALPLLPAACHTAALLIELRSQVMLVRVAREGTRNSIPTICQSGGSRTRNFLAPSQTAYHQAFTLIVALVSVDLTETCL